VLVYSAIEFSVEAVSKLHFKYLQMLMRR